LAPLRESLAELLACFRQLLSEHERLAGAPSSQELAGASARGPANETGVETSPSLRAGQPAASPRTAQPAPVTTDDRASSTAAETQPQQLDQLGRVLASHRQSLQQAVSLLTEVGQALGNSARDVLRLAGLLSQLASMQAALKGRVDHLEHQVKALSNP